MRASIAGILDAYTQKFGSDLIPRLRKLQAEGYDLMKELEGLSKLREEAKYHGDISTLSHSLQVLTVLYRLYQMFYFEERHRRFDIEALSNALSGLDFKLSAHLDKKVGNHTRKELLFFACLFHDIGKLKNFEHLMEEVKKNEVKGVARFIHHADFGRFYFDDELTDLDKKIEDFKEKLAKEQDVTLKQFYERVIRYFVEIKADLTAREMYLRKLQLGKPERKYIAFVIRYHMDMLNISTQFSEAYKLRNDRNGEKALNTCVKNLVKKVDEYGDYYIDCILLSFSDLFEAAQSSKRTSQELYLFLQLSFTVFSKKNDMLAGAKVLLKDDKIVFESASKKQQLNFSALFKSLGKDQALKIKFLIGDAADPKKALKDANYPEDEISKIMSILNS